MFVRVKDQATGHEFDVPEEDWRIGESFQLLSKKNYPPARSPRLAKHNVAAKAVKKEVRLGDVPDSQHAE